MAYLSVVIEKMLERLDCVEFGRASKVEKLKEKLKEARVYLDDAEGKQGGDERVKKWVEDVDKVVFKADDLVDEMSRSKKQKGVGAWINNLFTGRRSDEMIDEILKELEPLLGIQANGLHLRRDGDSSSSGQKGGYLSERLLDPLSWDEFDVLGRDVDKEKIVEKLLSSDDGRPTERVVSIVGVAGVGKTTLARLVCNDPRVKDRFDHRVWVTDWTFDRDRVLESLVEQITGIKVREESLALRDINFLFVLDDFCEKHLDILRVLMRKSLGSRTRILLTTQQQWWGFDFEYKLGALDEDDSWSLFDKVVFTGREAQRPEVMKLAREIVRKCRGIPLIIRAIGGILRYKNLDFTEWLYFYKTTLCQVLEDEDSLVPYLGLSYQHLPLFLKHSLTYCLLFPKDFEVDVQALVQVWVSHDSMPSHSTTCPEDLGYDLFLRMLNRSFFQETERDEWGNVAKCKLQSSFYDLAVSVVRENSFATLHLNEEPSCEKHPRHASFDFHLDSAWQIPTALPRAKTLRTLMLNRQSRWDVEGRSGDEVCEAATKFKLLRMLDLHNSGIKTVPSSIAGLKHLRYLDLSRNVNLKELPTSITSLWNLQTLKLNGCGNLRALPRDIDKLVNLRNLENESCYSLTHMPPKIGRLTNLRTVSEFVLPKSTTSKRSANLLELKNLNVLSGKLKIKNLRCPDRDGTKDALLKDKERLRSLVLIWDIEASTDHENSLVDLRPHENLRELCLSSYGGVQLSSWFPFLDRLVKLQLSKCPNCQWLPRLDKLPKLRVLVVDELTDMSFISKEEADEVTSDTPATFFPALEELRLTNLPKLEQWWKDADEKNTKFHYLSKLTVEHCPRLTSMPLFLTLEEITLTNTQLEPLERTINSTSVFKLKTLRMANMSRCDPTMFQSLPRLQSLTLDNLPDIDTDFLKKLGNVTTLRDLNIWRCDSLEQVSGWIGEIKSLESLSLRLCPNLIIPSEQISLVTCLSRIAMDNCPLASHVESMVRDRLYAKKPESTSKTNKGKETR